VRWILLLVALGAVGLMVVRWQPRAAQRAQVSRETRMPVAEPQAIDRTPPGGDVVTASPPVAVPPLRDDDPLAEFFVLMERGVRLTVVGPWGAPLEGVSVLYPHHGFFRTDALGRCDLPPPTGNHCNVHQARRAQTLTLHAPGHLPHSVFLERAEVMARLERSEATVRGQCRSDRGAPVADLELEIRPGGRLPAYTLCTDERGVFRADCLPRVRCGIRIRESRIWRSEVTELAPGPVVQVLPLYRYAFVRGRFILPEGASVPRGFALALPRHASLHVLNDGRFSLLCKPGRIELRPPGAGQLLAVLDLTPGERRSGVELAWP
jgi:hypothetical protein